MVTFFKLYPSIVCTSIIIETFGKNIIFFSTYSFLLTWGSIYEAFEE